MMNLKERTKVMLMYYDKKQFSNQAKMQMSIKYTIPSARERINRYVSPGDYSSSMLPPEKGGELVTSLNLSFGSDSNDRLISSIPSKYKKIKDLYEK